MQTDSETPPSQTDQDWDRVEEMQTAAEENRNARLEFGDIAERYGIGCAR